MHRALVDGETQLYVLVDEPSHFSGYTSVWETFRSESVVVMAPLPREILLASIIKKSIQKAHQKIFVNTLSYMNNAAKSFYEM